MSGKVCHECGATEGTMARATMSGRETRYFCHNAGRSCYNVRRGRYFDDEGTILTLSPEQTEVRYGVDGDTIIVATLTEGQLKILHENQPKQPYFSIKEISEALQTEILPWQERIVTQMLKRKP